RDGWPRLALATVNTHDLAPLAAFWRGRDIELRAELGLLDEGGVEREHRERAEDRVRLLDRLEADGAIDAGERTLIQRDGVEHSLAWGRRTAGESDAGVPPDPGHPVNAGRSTHTAVPPPSIPDAPLELVAGVHRFLRGTRSAMVGLSLDDLAREMETVNVTGVPAEQVAAWTRRMLVPLED